MMQNSQCESHNYFLISDKGLPNTDYIVTPFVDDGSLSYQQHKFNYLLQRCRQIVERVNMFLKLRFQSIKETIQSVTEEKADQIVAACIALHNYSILNGDLEAYSEVIDVEDLDLDFGMQQYYQSERVNEFSGTREYLWNYLSDKLI